MSRSAIKIRDVRSSVRKELASLKTHRSASLDMRSRGSYVPDKNRSSSDERKSGNKPFNNRWGSARKSSINLSEAKRKDTRPLTDKSYQKKKAVELVEFLEKMGYGPPISTSKLVSPNKKDFENIFQFLYNRFDPTYEVKKIEEEGPKILKNLGYSFTVNKSAFIYVARTNWPSLLGVIVWLMNLNKFALKVDMKTLFDGPGDDQRTQIHRILLRYICQCHHSGVDNEEEENAVFVEIIKSSMHENMDDLETINEQKKLRLESIKKEVDEVKKLQEHEALLNSNVQKYDDYILKMKTHCQKKKAVCDHLLEELKINESVLRALKEEVSAKQGLYDAQGFDGKKHLYYFEIQKKELSETLEKKRTTIKELQDKLWELEIRYSKNSDQINAEAQSFMSLYNSRTEETKELLQPLLYIKIPQIQKLCSSFHFIFPYWELALIKYNAESRKTQRNDFQKIVDELKGTCEILQRMYDSVQEKLNEIEMKKADLSTQLVVLSAQENKKEGDLQSTKKQTEDEMSALEADSKKKDQILKALHEKKSGFGKVYNEMAEELNELQEFQDRKKKELKEYSTEKSERYKCFEKNEKLTVNLCEAYGNEIAEKLEIMKNL